MDKNRYKCKNISFEEKVGQGIFPSKEEFSFVYFQNFTREEICQYFGFSESTFKKLRRFFNLPDKKHIIRDSESYKQRQKTLEETLNHRYGPPGSTTRAEFYASNRTKAQNTCLKKYGISESASLESTKRKRRETCLEKYGVPNAMQSEYFRQKASETDLLTYGCKHHIASAEVREKIKRTMLERYGTTCVTSLPAVSAKRVATNRKKYGVDHVLQSPEVRAKGCQTMYQNGPCSVRSSRQQCYIASLFNGELNVPFGVFYADCFLRNENLIIEYNGSGHDLSVRLGRETPENFALKEEKRCNYFISQGFNMFVLQSSTDRLPPEEVLLRCLSEAREHFLAGEHLYKIDLDTFIP